MDEADTMCDMGFLPDVRRILRYLPANRQNLFFSATMPPEIWTLSGSILNDPAVVEVDPIAPAKTVSHALYPSPEGLKKRLLFAILEKTPTGRAIIFTRTKHRARALARDLAKARYRVSALPRKSVPEPPSGGHGRVPPGQIRLPGGHRHRGPRHRRSRGHPRHQLRYAQHR